MTHFIHKPSSRNLIRLIIFVQMTKFCVGFFPEYVPDVNEDESNYEWNKKNRVQNKRNILQSCECGVYPDAKSVTPSFAWNALVEFKDGTKVGYCSGTLINSKFVLTGYSCLLTTPQGDDNAWVPSRHVNWTHVEVWISPNSPKVNPHSSPGLKVSNVFYDLDFLSLFTSSGQFENNIALVQLKKEIDFSSDELLRPVCLGGVKALSHSSQFKVIRWSEDEKDGRIKKQTSFDTDYHTLESCRAKSRVKVADGHICSSSSVKSKQLERAGNALVGLFAKDEKREEFQATQLGVASFNNYELNSTTHVLRYYTSVESVIPFIDYYSSENKAVWCKEPIFSGDEVKREGDEIPNPWDVDLTTSDSRKVVSSCTCGMRKENVQLMIVGGTTTTRNEIRWQVYLRNHVSVARGDDYVKETHICGGSIINDRFILSAAHCFVQDAKLMRNEFPPEVAPHEIDAYIHIHSAKNYQKSKRVKIKNVFYHFGYVEGQKSEQQYFDWDVALLELVEPLKFNQDVVPICLPVTGEALDPIGKKAMITGFGYTQPSGGLADYLQKIEVPVVNLSVCKKITYTTVTDRFLCAGTLNPYKDAARGDSGGPMSIVTDKKNQHVQIGIVSWAYEYSDKTAAYYTDVQKVLPFIDYYSARQGAVWCSR